MATEWRVRGTELANCNCAYGCPCQFNAIPTNGNCHAAGAWHVEEGHCGDVRLDELYVVCLYNFPGPVHHGPESSAQCGERCCAAVLYVFRRPSRWTPRP